MTKALGSRRASLSRECSNHAPGSSIAPSSSSIAPSSSSSTRAGGSNKSRRVASSRRLPPKSVR